MAMMIKGVEVVGDSGEVYTVTAAENGRVHCTCPAYLFSHTEDCKHIRFIAACFAVPVVS